MKSLVALPRIGAADRPLVLDKHPETSTREQNSPNGIAKVIAEILQLDASNFLKDARYGNPLTQSTWLLAYCIEMW